MPILHPRVSPKHFHPKTAHPTDVRALLEGQTERETEAERGAAEKEGERVGEKEGERVRYSVAERLSLT